MNTKRPSPWITIALIIALTIAASAIGGLVTGGSDDPWYAGLAKPRLNPPDITFAIVWPILFTLMAIGAVLVRLGGGSFKAASAALGLYFIQLAVNSSWSIAFFGAQRVAVAFVILVTLWFLIIAMIRAFWQHSKTGALLQLPYLAWVTFAGYLNGFIWWSNAGV